ncbi:hypothetical protein Dimus_003024, partial [Dionaea muscipula]
MAEKQEVAAKLESAPEYKEPRNESEIRSDNVNGEAKDFHAGKLFSPLEGEESDLLRSEHSKEVDVDMAMNGNQDGAAPELGRALEYKETKNDESEIRTGNIIGEASDAADFKSVSAVKDEESDDLKYATISNVDIDKTMDGEKQGTALELGSASECKELRNDDSGIRSDTIDGENKDSDVCEPISPLKDEESDPLNCSILNDGMSEENTRKGPDSRERRKSKYLSPPYVDLSKGTKDLADSGVCESENAMSPLIVGEREGRSSDFGFQGGSPPIAKCSSRKRKKKLPIKSSDTPGNLGAINVASPELLSELHLAALDCLYPCENRRFHLIEVFFTRFRGVVFQNVQVESKDTDTQKRKRKKAAQV